MSVLLSLKRFLHLTPAYDPSLTVRNVAYFSGSDAHVNHKLDIFLPAASNDARERPAEGQAGIPIIVHVHGGGWVRGSRSHERRGGPTVGRSCAQQGFVGIVVSYRLARISLMSYLAWSFIFGLAIIVVGLALLSWQLITGYLTFMLAAYAYHFFFRVRVPVNVEHVSIDIGHVLDRRMKRVFR